MEVAGMIFAIRDTIKIAQQLDNLARQIDRSEGTKLDHVYHRLVAEKAKTKIWVNYLRDRDGEDFLSSLNSEEYVELSLLIHRLEKYHMEAAENFERIRAAGAEGSQRSGTTKAKSKLVTGGLNDMNVMTDALAAMNEALRSMVAVLPAYDRGPAVSNPTARTAHAPQASDDPGLHSEHEDLRPVTASPSPSQYPSPPMEDDQQYLPTIQTIWRLALTSLNKLALSKRAELLINSASRLKLWGAGLFEDGFTLDDILLSRGLIDSPFRRIIVRNLASLLVLEGGIKRHAKHILDKSANLECTERGIKNIAAGGANSIEKHLLQVKVEITALLGTDELFGFAMEEWSSLLALTSGSRVADQPTPTESNSHNHGEDTDVLIARTVESLFDLLAGIRAERRAYCHDLEVSRAQENAEQKFVTLTSIRQQFEDVKLIIDAGDRNVRREGSNDTLAPTFAKVQARLEEFQANAQRSESVPASDSASSNLQSKLGEMSKTLCKCWLLCP
jgi:hypothetical protein